MIPIGRHISKLSGYAPALPTPFDDSGNVDAAAFERLCDRQWRKEPRRWSFAEQRAKHLR